MAEGVTLVTLVTPEKDDFPLVWASMVSTSIGIIAASLSQDLCLKVIHAVRSHTRQAAGRLWLPVPSQIEEVVRQQALRQPLRLEPFGDLVLEDLGQHVKLCAAVISGSTKSSALIDWTVWLSLTGDLARAVAVKTLAPI